MADGDSKRDEFTWGETGYICIKGRLSSVTKLTGKDDLIPEYLSKKIPHTVIARLLNVNRLTVRNYIITRKLDRL